MSEQESELVVTGFMVVAMIKGGEKYLSRVYTSRAAAEDFLVLAQKSGYPDATLQAVHNFEHGARRKHVAPPQPKRGFDHA
jgi:hypothetical protein